MGDPGPSVTMIEPAAVQELDGRIRHAQTLVRAAAAQVDEAAGTHRPFGWHNWGNQWVVADEFVAAFPHLRMRDGSTLACVYTDSYEERQSLLVAVRRPADPGGESAAGAALPPLPEPLKTFEMCMVMRRDREPDGLPDWVDWDVLAHVEDDASPQALFERSMLGRWVGELLNFGHGVHWPRHAVVAELADWTREMLETGEPRGPVPDDWRPRVVHRVPPGHPLAELPDKAAGRERIGNEVVGVVTFYSAKSYVRKEISRHRDWFVGGKWVWTQLDPVASGGFGYQV